MSREFVHKLDHVLCITTIVNIHKSLFRSPWIIAVVSFVHYAITVVEEFFVHTVGVTI